MFMAYQLIAGYMANWFKNMYVANLQNYGVFTQTGGDIFHVPPIQCTIIGPFLV